MFVRQYQEYRSLKWTDIREKAEVLVALSVQPLATVEPQLLHPHLALCLGLLEVVLLPAALVEEGEEEHDEHGEEGNSKGDEEEVVGPPVHLVAAVLVDQVAVDHGEVESGCEGVEQDLNQQQVGSVWQLRADGRDVVQERQVDEHTVRDAHRQVIALEVDHQVVQCQAPHRQQQSEQGGERVVVHSHHEVPVLVVPHITPPFPHSPHLPHSPHIPQLLRSVVDSVQTLGSVAPQRDELLQVFLVELVLGEVELGLAGVEDGYVFGGEAVAADGECGVVGELDVPVGVVHAVEPQQDGPSQMHRVFHAQRTHRHHQQQLHHLEWPQEVLALHPRGELPPQRERHSLLLLAVLEPDVGGPAESDGVAAVEVQDDLGPEGVEKKGGEAGVVEGEDEVPVDHCLLAGQLDRHEVLEFEAHVGGQEVDGLVGLRGDQHAVGPPSLAPARPPPTLASLRQPARHHPIIQPAIAPVTERTEWQVEKDESGQRRTGDGQRRRGR